MEKTPGVFIMIPPRVAMDRRRAENSGRPWRGGGGGLVSRVSGHVRPQDPGGGTVPTVSPRLMTIDEVSHVMELSGGGGGGGSAGPLQGFESVDRGDHCWGHSWTGV